MQSLAAARPARASTLPARFKDFMSTDVAEAASSPFATWSDSALGKKRSRADRGLMSMRELTVAFAQGHASPAITAMSSCRLLAELAGWPMNHLWTFWA
jgi:hypothetical protein